MAEEKATPFQIFITQMPKKWESAIMNILLTLNGNDLIARAIEIASKKKYLKILEGNPENRGQLSIELRSDSGWNQLTKDVSELSRKIIEKANELREIQFLMAADTLAALRTREHPQDIKFRADFTDRELSALKSNVINGQDMTFFIDKSLKQMILNITNTTVKAFMGASSNPQEVFEIIRRDVRKVIETAKAQVKLSVDDFIFMAIRGINRNFADAEIQRV